MTFKLLLVTVILGSTAVLPSQTSHYAAEDITKDLLKRANAVIRLDETTVTLQNKDKYTMTRKKVITILNDKADDYGDFRVFYKEGSSKITDIQIKLYDEAGRKIKEIKSKEIEDYIAYDGMSMISDGRVKYYDTELMDYPVTVEMSWQETSNTTLALPLWRPVPGGKVSVEYSAYNVINKTPIKLRVSERNLDGFDINQKDTYSYELKNQHVITSE